LLSFAPLSTAEIEQHLRSNMSLDEARLRSRLSVGSIGRAIALNLPEYRDTPSVLLEPVEILAFSRDHIRLLGTAEYLGKKLGKDGFEHHLDTLKVLLEVLLKLKLSDVRGSLINEDDVNRLESIAEALTVVRSNRGRCLWECLETLIPCSRGKRS
jgi:hypothetical protein